jgi:hypothetical protein
MTMNLLVAKMDNVVLKIAPNLQVVQLIQPLIQIPLQVATVQAASTQPLDCE